MQTTPRRSLFAPLVEEAANAYSAAADFVDRLLKAQWAAHDLRRYHGMSDAELAVHYMTRDEIADKVVNRYLK